MNWRTIGLAFLLLLLVVLVARRWLAGPSAVEPAGQGSALVEEMTGSEVVSEPFGGEAPDGDAAGVEDSESALPPAPERERPEAEEVAVVTIPIEGPAAERDAEYSSMSWFDDSLVLMPQYPEYFDGEEAPEGAYAEGAGPAGTIYTVDKADILAVLDGTADSVTPRALPFWAPASVSAVAGYEGYEAIGFIGDRVYMTVEADAPDRTKGFLVAGTARRDETGQLSAVELDDAEPMEVPLPASLDNMSLETLLVHGDELLTVFEANGMAVNPGPEAQRFDPALEALGPVGFPSIEYRVTDATSLDETGRFWVVNYFFPGEAELLQPQVDMLAEEWGEGPSHGELEQVERLVEMQLSDDAITLVPDSAPIQLQLIDADTARNWEGLVRLDDRGFLVVTDKYPETLLGFVARP